MGPPNLSKRKIPILVAVVLVVFIVAIGAILFFGNGLFTLERAHTPHDRYAYLSGVVEAQATAKAEATASARTPTPSAISASIADTPTVEKNATDTAVEIPLMTIANQGAGELTWRIFGVYQGPAAFVRRFNVGVAGRGSRELAAALTADPHLQERYAFLDVGADWYADSFLPFDLVLINSSDTEITALEIAELNVFLDSGRSVILALDTMTDSTAPIYPLLRREAGVNGGRSTTFASGLPALSPLLGDVPLRTPKGPTLALNADKATPLLTAANGEIYAAAFESNARIAVLGGDLGDWFQVNPSLVRQLLNWGNVAWLFIAPQSGELAAFDQVDVSTMLDTSSFLSGAHTAQIWIESNDPALPRLTVPLTLDIEGEAVAFVPGATLTFAEGYVGYPRTRSLVVENRGTDDLHVLDIGADFEVVTISPTTFTLPPLAQQRVTVVYTATTVGTLEGALTLTSNSALSPAQTIAVKAVSGFAPQIALNPIDPALDATQIFTTVNAQIVVGAPAVYVTATATPTPSATATASATPSATPTPSVTPAASDAPTSTPQTLLGLARSQGASLRQQPNAEAIVVATAPPRTLLQILSRSASASWLEVTVPGSNATAWIAIDEITVAGDLLSLPQVGEE